MPSTKQHLEQVQHNRDLLGSFDLEQTPYKDWVATIAFYAALHLIEAYLAGVHPPMHTETHKHRQDVMAKVPEFRGKIYTLYRYLEDQSRLARYNCIRPTKNKLEFQIIPKLAELEIEIQGLLNS